MANPVSSFHYFKVRRALKFTCIQVLIIGKHFEGLGACGIGRALNCSFGYACMIVQRFNMIGGVR
jgi:hypothetical protein